jgi:hypothetical protein
MALLSKNTFEVYAKKFQEVTPYNSTNHPEAFMQFCVYLQNAQLNHKLDAIMKHFEIDLKKVE